MGLGLMDTFVATTRLSISYSYDYQVYRICYRQGRPSANHAPNSHEATFPPPFSLPLEAGFLKSS